MATAGDLHRSTICSFLTPKPPLLFRDSVLKLSSQSESTHPNSLTPNSQSSFTKTAQPSSEPGSRVRISTGKTGGPAFVGQVFSMCDLSGTGLMAVSTHFDIPFLSKRTPEWLKKMFSVVTKSQRNGPVFRFFMDLGDAVSYVKQLNIPSGVVGACRLDVAYEHFKEKPHMFQFIPNERQVKEANTLLKTLPQGDGKKKVEGVPVFSAQNLDIAIATTDGIKWYTPYFFDKGMLDNILEESVDQHFHTLIETRNAQRQSDVGDDGLPAEAVEEMGESTWDPPEVQEVIEEIGHQGIPISLLAKAAEIQLLYAVDRVLLGNRWLRKATGIQPKFPYMVDSFEKKSEASYLRATKPSHLISNSEFREDARLQSSSISEIKSNDNNTSDEQRVNFQFPFGDWLSNPWSKQQEQQETRLDTRNENSSMQQKGQEIQSSPFLPKITMVGISTGESGKMSKAALKKTMDDVTKELERVEHINQSAYTTNDYMVDERDPLFVANVGDILSSLSARTSSSGWVRGG